MVAKSLAHGRMRVKRSDSQDKQRLRLVLLLLNDFDIGTETCQNDDGTRGIQEHHYGLNSKATKADR